MRGRGGGHRGGDRAAIKRIRPLLGDERQRRRQIGLHETVAGVMRRAVRAQKNARRLGIAAKPLGPRRDDRGIRLAQHKPVAGQRDRRGHDPGAVQPTIFPQRPVESHDRAGHPGGEIAGEARVAPDLAGTVEIHVARCGARRLLAEIDDRTAAVREADQHEPAAADIAAARIDDGQRVADRDRGVDRVAAGFQDFRADLAGEMVRADHHAVPAFRHASGDWGRMRDAEPEQQPRTAQAAGILRPRRPKKR